MIYDRTIMILFDSGNPPHLMD